MYALDRLSGAIDALNTAIGHAVRWGVLGMVLVGAFNAIARYSGRFVGVNLSSNALIEAQWYLFAAVFLLATPYALVLDRHVRVDVLHSRLSNRGRAAIDLAGTAVFLLPLCVFAVVISLPSVRASWAVWEQSPDPGGLPRYPVKTLVPVAFALLFLQGLAQAVKHVNVLRSER